jgi:hypothetical protein
LPPKGRPNVSAALLADIIIKMQATMAYFEFVSARPAMGPSPFGPPVRRRGDGTANQVGAATHATPQARTATNHVRVH